MPNVTHTKHCTLEYLLVSAVKLIHVSVHFLNCMIHVNGTPLQVHLSLSPGHFHIFNVTHKTLGVALNHKTLKTWKWLGDQAKNNPEPGDYTWY